MCRQQGIRCVYLTPTLNRTSTLCTTIIHIGTSDVCPWWVVSVLGFSVGFGCVHLIIKRNSQPTTISYTCRAPNLKERYKLSPSWKLHSLGCQKHNCHHVYACFLAFINYVRGASILNLPKKHLVENLNWVRSCNQLSNVKFPLWTNFEVLKFICHMLPLEQLLNFTRMFVFFCIDG